MKKCTLIVKDQVNIKFEGLNPVTRRRLVNFLKYPDPNARYSNRFKLKRWDGKVPFCTAACATYINMLPLILPVLTEEGYEIELDDRRPQLDWQFPVVDEEYLADKTWPEGHVLAGEPIMLREHQVRAINAFLDNWQSVGRICTGSGKTIICASLSKIIEDHTGGRTIVIVPNKSLVLQTEADYKNIGLSVGTWFGDKKDGFNDKSHVICTWHSLSILDKKGTKRIKLNDKWINIPTFDDQFDIEAFLYNVNCVIVDECHISPAKQLRDLLTGPLAHIPIRFGMTGTIPKKDYQFAAVLSGIGDICIEITSEELIEKGVLPKCNIHIVQALLQKKLGDFEDWDSEKKYTNTDLTVMTWLANFMKEITENSGSTLLLVENVETGKILEKLIPNSIFVFGATDADDRKEEYKRIDKTKNVNLIATFGVASTGINITFLFNVIIFNAGKSFTRVIQSLGRGLRKGTSELVDMEKDKVDVYDICTNLKWGKRHFSERKAYYIEENFPFTVTKVEI